MVDRRRQLGTLLNNRHQLTREERVRGGKAGFRSAVLKVQIDHGLGFNEAVCWLKRKIGWRNGSSSM